MTKEQIRIQREKFREEKFLLAEERIGKEATDALRELYSLYDERLYEWMASLWDKDVGGFYYSTSAKNTAGYFPDLESTFQVLDSMSWCGAFAHMKDPKKPSRKAYGFVLPAGTRATVTSFIVGLQNSEDGYFYHPMWGKQITVSRRGRDLNCATRLLSELGEQPLYDTPAGVKGALGAPSAAAKLDPAPTDLARAALPPQLRNVENFKKYLVGLDIPSNTYYNGNEIESQLPQILNADKRLWKAQQKGRRDEDYDVKSPAKDGFVEALLSHLRALQDPETGLFDKAPPSYNTINGLMKLSMSFRHTKTELPHAGAAIRSIIKVAKLPDDNGDTHMCCNFNLWRTVGDMLDIFSPENQKKLRELMKPHIAEMLRATVSRLKSHKRADGGFSYFKVGPCNYSQSAPVACSTVAESDVNATTIGCMGISGSICSSLGIPHIPPYCPADGDRFIELIKKAPSVKKTQKAVGDLYTYEKGEPIPIVAVWPEIYRRPNAFVELCEDKSILFTKRFDPKGSGDQEENIRFEIWNSKRRDNGYQVFEADLTVESLPARAGTFGKISFFSMTEYKEVWLCQSEMGEIFLADKEGMPISGTYLERGRKYHLRLEYYYDSPGKEMRLYLDTRYSANLTNLVTKDSPSGKPTVNLHLSQGFDGASVRLKNVYVAFVDGPLLS